MSSLKILVSIKLKKSAGKLITNPTKKNHWILRESGCAWVDLTWNDPLSLASIGSEPTYRKWLCSHWLYCSSFQALLFMHGLLHLSPASCWFLAWLTAWPWRWIQCVPPKCWWTPTKLHSITTQETVLFRININLKVQQECPLSPAV